MLAVKGIYKDGMVIIREKIKTEKPVNVIITFLEEVKAPVEEKLDMSKFSFKKTRKLLESYKGSFQRYQRNFPFRACHFGIPFGLMEENKRKGDKGKDRHRSYQMFSK